MTNIQNIRPPRTDVGDRLRAVMREHGLPEISTVEAETALLKKMAEDVTRRELEKCPMRFRDSLFLYLTAGLSPGHFLTAVLSNDLRESLNRADGPSQVLLLDLVRWLHGHAPSLSWGSADKVKEWSQASQEERHAVMVAALL